MTRLSARLSARLEDSVCRVAGGGQCGCLEEEHTPESCLDIRNFNSESGVHTLNIGGRDVTVYCDQTTDGGGWTVIQRRGTGEADFYRGWEEYVGGFGNASSEFWLGLENIHQLTAARNYSLRVDMTDLDGNNTYALYDHFYIDGADQSYRLHVSGYNGIAGDSLLRHDGKFFSTFDRDNDENNDRNCASLWKGAWWYYNCFTTDLNGLFVRISWMDPNRAHFRLKRAEMKIREL